MRYSPRIRDFISFLAWSAILFTPCVASSSQNASAQTSSDRGAAIFRKSCAVCHSVRPGEAKVGPSLHGVLREGSGHSEQAVQQAIADGKGTTPAFKTKLEPGEIDDLIECLRALCRGISKIVSAR
jgi:mono/diheme cytochrome c family protein